VVLEVGILQAERNAMQHMTRTVELDSGHEISVTLSCNGHWLIQSIDLETAPAREIEDPPGGPYLTQSEALSAAKFIAAKALMR
jgi:hypothetical protein